MTTNELILQLRNVKHILQERFGINKIALFGSYARGEATEDSDVDIAILKVEKKDYFNRVEAKYCLEKVLEKRVDIGYSKNLSLPKYS